LPLWTAQQLFQTRAGNRLWAQCREFQVSNFDFAITTAANLADAGSWLVHIFTVIWGS